MGAPASLLSANAKNLKGIGGVVVLLCLSWVVCHRLLASQDAPRIRNLTAHLILQPGSLKVPEGARARLEVGQLLTALEPISADGSIRFKDTPVNHPADTARLLISGLDYPGKVVGQSAFSFKQTDSISFFYQLELLALKGRVVDRRKRKPIPGIEIILENGLARAISGKDGRYALRMPNLEKERVEVELRQNGKPIDKRTMGFRPEFFEELKIQVE